MNLLNIIHTRLFLKGNHSLRHTLPILSRCCSSQNDNKVTEDEIRSILREKFPSSQNIIVEDVSGGCGAMFNIFVESSDFKGLSIVKQHKIVYDTLQQQIKNIHGLQLETKAS